MSIEIEGTPKLALPMTQVLKGGSPQKAGAARACGDGGLAAAREMQTARYGRESAITRIPLILIVQPPLPSLLLFSAKQ